jgi:hypothetical protein
MLVVPAHRSWSCPHPWALAVRTAPSRGRPGTVRKTRRHRRLESVNQGNRKRAGHQFDPAAGEDSSRR